MIEKLTRRLGIYLRDIALNTVASSSLVPDEIRCLIYRLVGLGVHTRRISAKCFFGGRDVIIGEDSFVNYGCFFDNSARIEIGRSCAIGMEVMFCTSSHTLTESPDRRAGDLTTAPVSVGDGCWIGTRAVILPGVSIGNGCVIAAGAVVTRDCEDNGLYAGVPATRIRNLDSEPLSRTVAK